MATRKCAPRPAFQIFLKRAGFCLQSEGDGSFDSPRLVPRSFRTLALIVLEQSLFEVIRNTCVMNSLVFNRLPGCERRRRLASAALPSRSLLSAEDESNRPAFTLLRRGSLLRIFNPEPRNLHEQARLSLYENKRQEPGPMP